MSPFGEAEQHEQLPRFVSTRKSHSCFLSCGTAICATFVVSLLCGLLVVGATTRRFSALVDDRHHYPNIMVQPCGTDPETARRRNCHFDVISFCWLPSRCYDAELAQDFDDANALEWFLDAERKHPLSHEQIMTGNYTGLYVNWEYHIRHCTAMWKKLHRAVLGRKNGREAIDSYIGVYTHTEHCEHMLIDGRKYELEAINTRIAVKYPDCGI